MKKIKNFYGFGKDGYEINGIIQNYITKPLKEEDLNSLDNNYIRSRQTTALNMIGKRLDIEHYQVFYQKKEARFDGFRKYYDYGGQFYNIQQLSDLGGFSRQVIYNRINRGWSIKKIMETPLNKNSKSFKLNKCHNETTK